MTIDLPSFEPYAGDPQDLTLQIVQLQEVQTSYDLFTRIYPYGAGIGGQRLTLAACDDALMPAGYTVSCAGNYIERDSAVATYGRIDRVMEFPDITPVDNTDAALTLATNELRARALQHLMRGSELQRAYQLQVAPSRYDVWPGQTIRVVYHEWCDGYHAVDIDRVLWVLETATSYDRNSGRRLVGLTVATVDRMPTSDQSLLVDVLAKGEVSRRQPIVRASLSDVEAGVPVVLAIADGLVREVRRVTPAGDGRYANPTAITIKNGIVTSVET